MRVISAACVHYGCALDWPCSSAPSLARVPRCDSNRRVPPPQPPKLESKRIRQRTRARAHDWVGCGASGHNQPQRNLQKTSANCIGQVKPTSAATDHHATKPTARKRTPTWRPQTCTSQLAYPTMTRICASGARRPATPESKRALRRTRRRAHDRVGCGASGLTQPQRNLRTRLRMDSTDPSGRCRYSKEGSHRNE